MKNSHIRPSWWVLYLLCADIMGLFWLETNAPFTRTVHILVEIGLVLVLFGLITAWLKENKFALFQEDQEKRRSAFGSGDRRNDDV